MPPLLWLVEKKPRAQHRGAHFTRGRSARAQVCAARSAGQEVANTGAGCGAQDVANKNLVITFGSKPIIQPGSYMTFGSSGDHTLEQNEKMHDIIAQDC